jgi:hypothetical protein
MEKKREKETARKEAMRKQKSKIDVLINEQKRLINTLRTSIQAGDTSENIIYIYNTNVKEARRLLREATKTRQEKKIMTSAINIMTADFKAWQKEMEKREFAIEKSLIKEGNRMVKALRETMKTDPGYAAEFYKKTMAEARNLYNKAKTERHQSIMEDTMRILKNEYLTWKTQLQRAATQQIEQFRIAYQELYNQNRAIVASTGGKIPPKGTPENKQIAANRKQMKAIEKQIEVSPFVTLYEFSKMIHKG